MRKLRDNPIQHFQIGAVKGFPQLVEKCDLRRVQRTTVQMEPLRNSEAAVTAWHRFNRIGAGQYSNISADGF